jgi:uncharacterized cupin superfamily protein
MDILVSRSDLELQPAPICPEWVLEGEPTARNRVISKSQDGTAITLLWDCTAGRFNWIYDTDETVYVIEGSATLTDPSGTRRIAAGDVVFFPAGTQATWRVGEYVRKVAVFRHALPRPLGLAVRLTHRANLALARAAGAVLGRTRAARGVRAAAPTTTPYIPVAGDQFAA